MSTQNVSVDAFWIGPELIQFLMLVLMLTLILDVSGATEINVFLSSVNARVNAVNR